MKAIVISDVRDGAKRTIWIQLDLDGKSVGGVQMTSMPAATGGFDVFAYFYGEDGEQNIEKLAGRGLTEQEKDERWKELFSFYGIRDFPASFRTRKEWDAYNKRQAERDFNKSTFGVKDI